MSAPQLSYRVSPAVRWVVEKRGLLLVGGDGSHLRLGYPEAAIWDLLSRGYRTRTLVSSLAHIVGVDDSTAMKLLFDTARDLLAAGFLSSETSDG